ncbi:MAG: hypothetical protein ACE5KZ_09415 [Candidatus Scalinduaceae bacterium]
MSDKKPEKRNICITCYNQHGCLTKEPLCLLLKRNEAEKSLLGKELMERRGLLSKCQECAHFRLCWTEEIYKGRLCLIKD